MTMSDDPWARSPRAQAWIVLVDEDPETGARRVRRRPLNMPLAVATAPLTADGGLDLSSPRISNRVISDLIADLTHEQHRRAGTLHVLGGWTPGKPSRDHPRMSERANTDHDHDERIGGLT